MAEEKPINAVDSASAKDLLLTEMVEGSPEPKVEADVKPNEEEKKLLQERSAASVSEAREQATLSEKKKPSGGITLALAFEEESNLASDLLETEIKALYELKKLLQAALTNRQLFPSGPPQTDGDASQEQPSSETKPDKSPVKAKEDTETPKLDAESEEDSSSDEKGVSLDDDGTKTVEAIAETVVPISAPPLLPEDPEGKAYVPTIPSLPSAATRPDELLMWGVPLLGDERSETVLLKFLRARDLKAKEALEMIKKALNWRRAFDIESLIKEELVMPEMEKVVFMSGKDREGHPVCYNAYGELQKRELYEMAFADDVKQQRFIRWRIQCLEKGIRQLLDFKPGGVCAMVQVTDLRNSPWPLKGEFRQILSLLLDNYPEFLAKQVFVNVPWWYLAFNRMISPFLTQRTKSKLVCAGPSKSAETLFRYIAPEQVPVQFGGLYSEKDSEFTIANSAKEAIIQPSAKKIIEIPLTEPCLLVWEFRVLGWDVSCAAEFVPSSEESYTIIVQKAGKIASSHDPIVKSSFKVGEPGKLLLTVDNTSKKKKLLLYRYKTKGFESS